MSQRPCWPAVSGRQTLALLLGLGALGETEAYLQDTVLSSARFVEDVTFGISGATHLVLTLTKRRRYGRSVKVLLRDYHVYHFGQVSRKICQMPRCPAISYSVHLCYRMCLVTWGQLNLFPPAYFHLIPALPLLVVHRTVATGIPSPTPAKSHSGSPRKLNKE